MFAVLTAVLLSTVPATRAIALEFGMTPNHVYALWRSINDTVIATSSLAIKDPMARQRIESMTPHSYRGKQPREVLHMVLAFGERLNKLRARDDLPPTGRYGDGHGEVNATGVFLNSGMVLNGMVEWIIVNSDPDLLVSRYYHLESFRGKTSSDVYALVDLAHRRLDVILSNSYLMYRN